MSNKVKYNLKNVHAAKLTESVVDGVTSFSYDTPKAIPGAVSISLAAEGDSSPFYADGIVYFRTSSNNGYSGVWTRVLNVDPTCTLDVEGNGTKAFNSSTTPGIFFQGNDTHKSIIEKGANVTIKNNAGAGIYTKQAACNLTINAAAVITNNGTGAVNKDKIGADMGGGIYNVGTIVLCPEVELYNNHAAKAGDDIYNAEGASIAFGGLGSDWWLDGAPDCDGKIHKSDGWYEDGMPGEGDAIGKRWCGTYDGNVCVTNGQAYMESMQAGQYETKIALKAAHGAQTTPPVTTPYKGGGGD